MWPQLSNATTPVQGIQRLQHFTVNYHSVLPAACEVTANHRHYFCLIHEETESQRQEVTCVRARGRPEQAWSADLLSTEPSALVFLSHKQANQGRAVVTQLSGG